jgi:hypothetical protein
MNVCWGGMGFFCVRVGKGRGAGPELEGGEVGEAVQGVGYEGPPLHVLHLGKTVRHIRGGGGNRVEGCELLQRRQLAMPLVGAIQKRITFGDWIAEPCIFAISAFYR